MRAYGRRHRRWSRRNPQPLLLVPDEPLVLVGLAAIGLALFRYRSELAPVTAACSLAVAGLLLHLSHPDTWPWIAAVTACAAFSAARWGMPWRLDRPEERIYASAVTTVAGAWLAAATAHGPGRSPLPAVLVVTTLALAVPWWTHRRRRARVRVDRIVHSWPDIAEAVGLAGSRVMSAVVDTWGWRARMALRHGQSITDVVAHGSHLPGVEHEVGPAAAGPRC